MGRQWKDVVNYDGFKKFLDVKEQDLGNFPFLF